MFKVTRDASTQTEPIPLVRQKLSKSPPAEEISGYFVNLKVAPADQEKLSRLRSQYVAIVEVITTAEIERDKERLRRLDDLDPINFTETSRVLSDLRIQHMQDLLKKDYATRDQIFKEMQSLRIREERSALRN